MKKIILLAGLQMLCFFSFAQSEIVVAELTVKVAPNSTEELMYGFAEGDQIVFSFEEVEGKELKEIEIVEHPATSKFMDYESKKIENKIVNVVNKAVYKFKLKNSNLLKARICRIKISRIPASEESKSFNTSVKWVVENDTTWHSYTKDILIGYDTIYTQKTRKVIESEESYEEVVMDKTQRVHSRTNENGNKTSLFFTLPRNMESAYETKKVIAWAYWVGVGEESNNAWQQNRNIITQTVKGVATKLTSPLGALAIGAITSLVLPTIGEDVSYGLTDENNKNLFYGGYEYQVYDSGKGIAGYKKFTDKGLLQGTFFIVMSNDNYMQGIDATVKVAAIMEHKKYKDEAYTDMNVNPKYEKKIFTDPVITARKFPATYDYKPKK